MQPFDLCAPANREDGAHIDVVARDVWGRNKQRVFFDVRVVNLGGAETPLVFAATGGMRPSATTVFRKLASKLANKWNVNYSCCLFWLRCKLCFSLLRSGMMCLRGHQSSTSHPNVDLAIFQALLSELLQLLVPSSCPASAGDDR